MSRALRSVVDGASSRPVIIVGPGRSGTTLLQDALARHRDLAWFNGLHDRFPERPESALLSRLAASPRVDTLGQRLPKWPSPGETYGVWNHYFPGFSKAGRDWGAADVSDAQVEAFRRFVGGVTRWHGRPRLLAKITGFPRVSALRRMFPDATIVHIDRDPRAVVASYVKQRWFGYKLDPVGFEALSDEDRLGLYGRHYLEVYRAYRDGPRDGCVSLRYEQLVADFEGTVRSTVAEAGLHDDPAFSSALAAFTIRRDTNDSWRASVSPSFADKMTAYLEEPLREMGYVTA